MKYWQAHKLSSRKFKRLTGVKRKTFQLMVRLVKKQQKLKKKPGRPSKIIIENQVLLTLQYWREYRTYYHISQDWKIDESNVCRIVKNIENILIKSKRFSLPGHDVSYKNGAGFYEKTLLPTSKLNGVEACPIFRRSICKKKLLDSSLDEDLILMDVMESPIERPKKHQKRFYSGKQGEHTLKTQVVFGRKTNKIMCLAHSKGKTHDFKLFKNSDIKFHRLLKVIADKGYQGITKFHNLSQTPIKKPRGGKLTKSQKKYNRELNRLRIAVEHVNRRLKIFKILSYPYRNRHRRFGLRANLIAGIYNYELAA